MRNIGVIILMVISVPCIGIPLAGAMGKFEKNQIKTSPVVKKETPSTFQESLDSISLPGIAMTDSEQKLLKLNQEVQNKINDLLSREKAVVEAEKKSKTYLITCFCDDCEGSPVEDFTEEEYDKFVKEWLAEKKAEEDHHNRRGRGGRRRRR